MINKLKIIKLLEILNIESNQYCVLGSASLVIRNIKINANDLDIAITPSEFTRLNKNYKIIMNKLIIYNSEIEFIIKEKHNMNIEMVDGYPLQNLYEMLKNKKKKNLQKDKDNIIIIEKYLKESKKMGEYIDLYDENKKLTGEVIFREKGKKANPPECRYTIVVLAFIQNSEGKYLIQKTSARKKSVWALPGGHVKSGQSSKEAICEEIKEEMGIEINIKDIKIFKTYKYENAFKDVFVIHKDIDLNKVKLEEDEVEKVEYLSKKDISNLVFEQKFRKTNIDAIDDFFEQN